MSTVACVFYKVMADQYLDNRQPVRSDDRQIHGWHSIGLPSGNLRHDNTSPEEPWRLSHVTEHVPCAQDVLRGGGGQNCIYTLRGGTPLVLLTVQTGANRGPGR